MEASKYSITALIAAFCRAHHYAHDESRIFEDPYAYQLLTVPELEFIEAIYIDGLTQLDPQLVESCPDRRTIISRALRAGVSAAWVLARARYVEDKLSEALLRGVSQYVIIGAGFDTFAFRRPELQERVKVFEIDHPATQTFKRQRLIEVGLEPPPNLLFAAADLERESVATVLSREGYELGAPAFFAWPGVTMYLTRDAIVETLCSIRSIATPGSQLVFDYIETDAFAPDKASERVQQMLDRSRLMGEPWISGFDPQALGTELSNVGFRLLEDLSPQDQQARYFGTRTDGFRATEHSHFVCTESSKGQPYFTSQLSFPKIHM